MLSSGYINVSDEIGTFYKHLPHKNSLIHPYLTDLYPSKHRKLKRDLLQHPPHSPHSPSGTSSPVYSRNDLTHSSHKSFLFRYSVIIQYLFVLLKHPPYLDLILPPTNSQYDVSLRIVTHFSNTILIKSSPVFSTRI